MPAHETLTVERDPRGVTTVVMDRPDAANAFDDALVTELTDVAVTLRDDPDTRVVVLTGRGRVFSGGADLRWMRSAAAYTYEENLADASRMDAMLRGLYDLPKPLVARVNGPAVGGGTGLIAVCDVAVASEDAAFAFTEVRLGIAPALIAPYVVRKVGPSFARSSFVTGERFGADRALAVGLVHQVVPAEELDAAVARVTDRCRRASPNAAAAAKRLPDLALAPLDEAATEAARMLAALRVSEDGQEGMAAFLEKRPPAWAPDDADGA